MPSTSTDNGYRERKRQLYLQNKDKINTRRRMLYKTRRSTLLAESTRTTNVVPPEHPSTPVASPTPPTTLPTSAQLTRSNSNPFIPSPSMTLHIHPSTTPASNTPAHDCHNPPLEQAHRRFRTRLDQMHPLHVCSICKESYPSMKVKTFRGLPTCLCCAAERYVHRFSLPNNMDPSPQPHVLSALTQVEEMLIARVNPILQVSHARGGQLKYSGHTICFPQDITNIVNTLPRMLSELDILVVNKPTSTHKSYAFFVSRSRVMAALEYKLANDPYFKDVQINPSAVAALPLHPTDVSPLLRHVAGTSHATTLPHENADLSNTCLLDPSTLHPSSFVATLPNSNTELDAIHAYLETPHSNPTCTLQWPTVGLSPINEYNTEGLFSIAFPSLFPTGSSMINQPRLRDVEMHELALHLMRYHDNRFAQHPRFRYFLYNLIMRHRSQSTASVFVKKSIEDNLPATAADLRQHLLDLQHSALPDQIMRFGSSLRGTQSYWNKCRGELGDMITQLGTPTLFFTLSAADTKWHDLHQLMPGIPPTNPADQHKWRIKNIIANPHLASQYIHCRFTLFLEEVLKKGLHTTDYWCRYATTLFSLFISLHTHNALKPSYFFFVSPRPPPFQV